MTIQIVKFSRNFGHICNTQKEQRMTALQHKKRWNFILIDTRVSILHKSTRSSFPKEGVQTMVKLASGHQAAYASYIRQRCPPPGEEESWTEYGNRYRGYLDPDGCVVSWTPPRGRTRRPTSTPIRQTCFIILVACCDGLNKNYLVSEIEECESFFYSSRWIFRSRRESQDLLCTKFMVSAQFNIFFDED